ncbi:MAG: tyrosine-type recombinase/integrase [Bacteriovoracia bacterium]
MIIDYQNKDGSVTYRAKVYIDGRQMTETFKRKKDAQLWKQQMLVDRQRGTLKTAAQESNKTLSEFSQDWFETRVSNKSPKTQTSYRTQLENHILPVIGKIRLCDLRIIHGHKVVSALRSKNKSPKGINMALCVLKGILNDAVKWDVIDKSPFRNLELEKVPPRAAKYWMPDEIAKFLKANMQDELYELWVVALNTGMRRGELGGLKWDKVDFTNRLIEVSRVRDRHGLRESTKTCSSFRYVPMNHATEVALKTLQLEKRHREYVFATKCGSILDVQHISEREFTRAIKRAGVSKIRFHDLRGTFASNVCMAPEGDLYGLSKILGHSSVEMTTKKYAHLHNSFLKRVVSSVNFTAEGS